MEDAARKRAVEVYKVKRIKRVLVVEFSGGRTSAFMAKLIKARWDAGDPILRFRFDEIIFVFMNTGLEDLETLVFADQCDRAFGFNLLWLEADPHRKRFKKGEGFKIVTFETACRDKRIYNAMCSIYGIPNKWAPHCTRELKLRPLRNYLRLFPHKFIFCIGIRADEPGRLPKKRRKGQLLFKKDGKPCFYPLAYVWPTTKTHILNHWAGQPFDLKVAEHFGNCTLCFKKSLRKKMTVALERPDAVKPWDEMEREHGNVGEGDYDKFSARDGLYVRDIIAAAQSSFEPFRPEQTIYDPKLDVESACICA